MDFRKIRLHDVVEFSGSKKTPSGRFYQLDTPIRFQTPTARCRYDEGRLTTYFDPAKPVDRDFMAFVSAIDSQAEACLDLDPLATWSDALWNGSMRSMVFDGVEFFEESGAHTKYPPDPLNACCCLLECQGCWTTADKAGLRFKVLQIRAAPAIAKPVPAVQTKARPVHASQFAFIESAEWLFR